MANGVVFYHGKSMLDGQSIVGILTGIKSQSVNPKTGPMLQAYIVPTGDSPVNAARSGLDAAVCGDCPLRAGVCYVNLGQAPTSIWRAWRRGSYPTATLLELASIVRGRAVRFGAYGDPAAVPLEVWQAMASTASRWTGYTHQWRRTPQLAPYCMASADSMLEAREAQRAGWRTFRVRRPNGPRIRGEAGCPASAEAGHAVQCISCPIPCSGTSVDAPSVSIIVHGATAQAF